MDTEKKQLELDKRYIRMASIWAENSYCQRRKVGALIVKDTDTMVLLRASKTYARTRIT